LEFPITFYRVGMDISGTIQCRKPCPNATLFPGSLFFPSAGARKRREEEGTGRRETLGTRLVLTGAGVSWWVEEGSYTKVVVSLHKVIPAGAENQLWKMWTVQYISLRMIQLEQLWVACSLRESCRPYKYYLSIEHLCYMPFSQILRLSGKQR